MRRIADGPKQLGYVILPVVIPVGMKPHEALNDNKVYKVVWEVLHALRSHDGRFDAMINKLDLIGRDTPNWKSCPPKYKHEIHAASTATFPSWHRNEQ